MEQSYEYQQEVMKWRIQEEERIQKSIDTLSSLCLNSTNRKEYPFLANFIESNGTHRLLIGLLRLLDRMKDCVKHPELSDSSTSYSISMLSHSEIGKCIGSRKSKAGAILYFLLLAGFITRVKADDVKSQEFRDNMKSFIKTKKQDKIEKEAKILDIKETSLLCVPNYDSDRLEFIESRLKTLNIIHARRSGLTYGYIYTIFGKDVADSVFPFNESLSDKTLKDQKQIEAMKAFVLSKIKIYGFFRLQMFKSFEQVGRTGKVIKRGFNYSHWKIVQALLIMEGRFVYERAGQALIESAISDKEQYSKDITKKCLTKENGRMACPCILVDKWKYMEYKVNARSIPLRHKQELDKYIIQKNDSFKYGF